MKDTKIMNRNSFKISLIFVLAAILLIVVVLGFSGGLNIASFQQNYTESLVSSYAVSGSETLRKIEYAVVYGKPLDDFYGIEELLQERIAESQDLQQANIVLPEGRVIYNQNGALTNQVLPDDILERVNFSTPDEAFIYVQHDDQYHIFLPIRDRNEEWVGSLSLVFNESVVQKLTREYMSKLVLYLLILAFIAAIALIFFVLKFSIFTLSGELRKKRLLIGILVILSAVQIVYGVINYHVFRDAYVQIAEQNTSETVRVVQKDIEFVVENGVPYTKLYELERYLENILRSVPEIASISITNTAEENSLLYTTLEERAHLSDVEDRWLYESSLMTDSQGTQPLIQVQLSSEYVNSKLKSIILDTVTVLVTSFLFMVEITLLLLIFLRKKVANSWPVARTKQEAPTSDVDKSEPAPGTLPGEVVQGALQSSDVTEADDQHGKKRSVEEEAGSIVRPLAFILSIAVFMSSAFIPIVMKKLYEEQPGALFGLSESVAVALPLSIEMLFAGLATIMAGYLVDRQGWKPIFFIGMLFLATGMLLSGLAWEPLIFVLARGIAGIGYGLSFMAMRGFVNAAPTEKSRTDGVSSFLAGLYAGINCGVIVGAMLADRIGFAQVFFVALCVVAIACLFAFAFIENRRPIVQKTGEKDQKKSSISVFQFLTNPKIIGFFALIVLPIAICSMFLDFYFPVYAESIGVSTSDVGRAFLINGLFIVYLGPFLSKYMAKYVSLEKSVLFSGLIVVVAMLIFAISGSLWAAFVAIILLGISDSFGLVAQNNYYVKLQATQQIGIGKALGYYDNVRKIGQMLGPMIIGLLLFAGIQGISILGIAFLVALIIFWVLTKAKDSTGVQQDRGVGL